MADATYAEPRHDFDRPKTTAEVHQSMTGEVIERIDHIGKMLMEAREDLTMLEERIFGPSAVQPGRASGEPQSLPVGQAANISQRLEGLAVLANQLTGFARTLNARI